MKSGRRGPTPDNQLRHCGLNSCLRDSDPRSGDRQQRHKGCFHGAQSSIQYRIYGQLPSNQAVAEMMGATDKKVTAPKSACFMALVVQSSTKVQDAAFVTYLEPPSPKLGGSIPLTRHVIFKISNLIRRERAGHRTARKGPVPLGHFDCV